MSQSEHFPDNFYRVTVKGLCVKDGKLLLVREPRAGGGQWDLPGGGLDFGESFQEGLEREVREETGLTINSMSKQPVYVWSEYVDGTGRVAWFYSLVIAFAITFDHLDFSPSEECAEIAFFSKDELYELPKVQQLAQLPGLFNPTDFA